MSFPLLSRRAALLTPPFVRNELWRRARAVPLLDLRFAERKDLIDAVSGQRLITFTRSTSGTFVNSQGVITTAAADVPRFTHDPVTGESLGLLVEEQRTNSIRNNTMVGAVAGTPGTVPTNWSPSPSGSGLTREVIGTGTENGIAYIDIRYSGTTTASGTISVNTEGTTQIPAASGQAWTSSSYIKLIGGSLSGLTSPVLSVIERSAAGGFLVSSTVSLASISNAASIGQRFSVSRTLTNASTAYVMQQVSFGYASGSAVDITVRFGLPQLEQGLIATSPIPTSGSTVTRNPDLADLVNSAIANNIRTLYLEFRSPASGTRGVASLNNNTANNRANVLTSGTDPLLVVADGGVEQANIDGGTTTENSRTRVVVRINTNNFAISVNGGAPVIDTSGTVPTVDRLMLGRSQAGEYLNGPIARAVGWREALSNATLQALSA